MHTPPDDLDATARALWRRVLADMAEREVLHDVDLAAVARYCRAEQLSRLAFARVAAREKAEGGAAWRVRGSHGGWMPDPDVRIGQQAAKDAASFAHDLGITPRSRHALRESDRRDDLDRFLADLAGGPNR